MKAIERTMSLVLLCGMLVQSYAQEPACQVDLENYQKESISSRDLAEWDFRGMGSAYESGGGQFCLSENDSSLGAVLISPRAYAGDVVIRYKTLALTSATVLVVMHSATDLGSDELSISDDYNGNMGLWIKDKDNYFYAFRNAPHSLPPFIRKYPHPGTEALVTAEKNFMVPGVYYSIEVGRMGNKLWLSVDGKKIIETEDESILPGGHVVFRIRGTAGFKAACLIKDLEILSQK